MFFTTAVDFVCAIVFSPMPNMIVMIASTPEMNRVLMSIAIALLFIGYPPFHRLRSPKVVLVLQRLIYRVHHFRNVHFVKTLPNIGRPLFDCSRHASSWITYQCSTRMLSLMRRIAAALQFTGRPKSENRPCTI